MKERLKAMEVFAFTQERSEPFVLCNKDIILAEFHIE